MKDQYNFFLFTPKIMCFIRDNFFILRKRQKKKKKVVTQKVISLHYFINLIYSPPYIHIYTKRGYSELRVLCTKYVLVA